MKRFVMVLIFLLGISSLADATCLRGDFDGNGTVNIADFLGWYSWMWGEGGEPVLNPECACDLDCILDVNRDGDVCPGDMIDLYYYIFGMRELDLSTDDCP